VCILDKLPHYSSLTTFSPIQTPKRSSSYDHQTSEGSGPVVFNAYGTLYLAWSCDYSRQLCAHSLSNTGKTLYLESLIISTPREEGGTLCITKYCRGHGHTAANRVVCKCNAIESVVDYPFRWIEYLPHRRYEPCGYSCGGLSGKRGRLPWIGCPAIN
jgi:hypothetical protein